jgi:hypothetical protein
VAETPPSQPIRDQLRQRVVASRHQGLLRGSSGWLFLGDEARLLLADCFWGEAAQRVSSVVDPSLRDPLPAILEFHRQLAARGIELLVVPVPSKLAIYPELYLGLALGSSPERLDEGLHRFLAILEQNDVLTLDLAPSFLAAREPDPDSLYLPTDSHWSPRGVALAAESIVETLTSRTALARLGWQSREPRISVLVGTSQGDIVSNLPRRHTEVETVHFRRVGDGGFVPLLESRAEARLLLIGDSHLLVYASEQSSLQDHLEGRLGESVDQLAVQAGGPTAARERIARDAGRLRGKQVVIWILAARSFVSGLGWKSVPLGVSAREPAVP